MKARTAIVFSFASRYSTMGLRAAGLVVLARLLNPDEIGVFVTATAVTSLLFAFAEFGLHNYLIQVPRLTRSVVRAAVGLSLALSGAALALLAAAVILAPDTLFDPRLKTAALLVSTATAMQPLTLPITAKLQRDMRFDRLFAIEFGRTVVQVGTAVGLALFGFGFLSLAWAAFAEGIAAGLLAVLLGSRGRFVMPGLSGWGPVLRFGGAFAGVGALDRAAEAGSMALIGWRLGYGAAGLLNRAQVVTGLLDKMFTQALTPVVLPILSQAVRRDGDLKRLYIAKVSYLTAIQWPFFAVLGLLAGPVVHLMLGPTWSEAVPVVQVLALSGLFLPFSNLSLKFFVALGDLRSFVGVQAWTAAARLAAVAALTLVSLPAAAFAFVLSGAVRAALIAGPLKRRLGCRWDELAACAGRAAIITVLAGAGPAAVLSLAGGLAPVPLLALSGAAAAAGWVAGVALTGHVILGDLAHAVGAVRGRAPRLWRSVTGRFTVQGRM